MINLFTNFTENVIKIMKIERTEYSVKLLPESQFERECLKLLKDSSIKSKQFEDAWNGTGPLIITFPTIDEHYNGY